LYDFYAAVRAADSRQRVGNIKIIILSIIVACILAKRVCDILVLLRHHSQ
jgi:hypothetical protein